MLSRILSLLIGYCFGCVLTAELIAKYYAGKSAAELGETGNPGMANIMASLGFKPGIFTLIGDVCKCVYAMTLAWLLFKSTGWIVLLWAGLGCTLGHDFPFWRRFRGGKGVAVSSAAIVVYSPLWGILANLAGMLVTFATKYLCVAGPVIPLFFTLFMLIRGDWEAAGISAVLSGLSVYCNLGSLRGIRAGTTSKTDVLGALARKLGKKPPKRRPGGRPAGTEGRPAAAGQTAQRRPGERRPAGSRGPAPARKPRPQRPPQNPPEGE